MRKLPDIALLGKAQSGKDTTGSILVERYGYVRVAYADELKSMALEIDPYIPSGYESFPLTHLVKVHGWDTVKVDYPAARTFLKNLGVTLRKRDPYFWVNKAMPAIWQAHRDGRPVVLTDTRFGNEARVMSDELGGLLVRILRDGTGGDNHISETELDGYPVDRTLDNNGSLPSLEEQIRTNLLSL